MTRSFTSTIATREKTPILVGLVGPSGSGKTYSALRLAAGFQKVTGGETYFIDTEARRALHYAERFKFRHVAFGAPFGPLDYLAAIEHCVKQGASTIVIDSMSHEHEGPGGLLEMHAAEHARLGGRDGTKMLAWNKPKSERRRLINSVLQLPVNFVFCFRAKEKLKIERGKDPVPLGFQPIGGDEFVYEMTLKCLLLPGANGVPTWRSDLMGEKAMIKLPEQFRATFGGDQPPQLTEEIGEKLATWAAGGAKADPAPAADLLARYAACADGASLRQLEDARKAAWSATSADDKRALRAAAEEAKRRIDAALGAPPALTPEEIAQIEAAERAEAAAAPRERQPGEDD
jgi:ABC-type dipeptide/oligopeptide/nickel transport system ATPase subunit